MKVLWLACAAAALGCAATHEPENGTTSVGSQLEPLYVLSSGLWDPGERVPVCWTAGSYASDKALARRAFTNTWQSLANVAFVGWDDCPATGFTGIKITPGDVNVTYGLGRQASGVLEMGLDFSTFPQDVYNRCIFNGLDRAACIRATAIHEFGHALGFAHEQLRPDNNGACDQGLGSGTPGDTLVGPFDTTSIMSYCGYSTELTPGDRLGANVAYGMAPALLTTVL